MNHTPLKGQGASTPQRRIDFAVGGMHCASCSGRVEKVLGRVPGVSKASVNIATHRATVEFPDGAVTSVQLEKAVADAGYTAEIPAQQDPASEGDEEPDSRKASAPHKECRTPSAARGATAQQRSLLLSAVLAAPLFVLEMGRHFFPAIGSWLPGHWHDILEWILATLILAGPGREFFVAAFKAARHRTADMNTLVALGVLSAYGYSVAVVLFPSSLASNVPFSHPGHLPPVYFESAALIVTFVLFGRFLEERARGKASEAVHALQRLQPKTARVERNGMEVDLAIESLTVGDLVRVRPGERIPADGKLLDGSSNVDESMLTGEAVPVVKQSGSLVAAGTLNKNGTFRFKVEAAGAGTVLQQIARMVEDAQGGKAPIQRLADRVAAVFVPAVVGLAVVTFFCWLTWGPSGRKTELAMVTAVSVLIIACPCALGLATPTAIMVGVGLGARRGILIRGGAALELAYRVTTVVFDKTGTITDGNLTVADVESTGCTENELLRWLGSAELGSEHPLAEAVCKAARQRAISLVEPSNFISHSGEGILATVDGEKLVAGTSPFLRRHGISMDRNVIEKFDAEDKSVIFVGRGGRFCGVLTVADQIKSDSSSAIRELHGLGLKLVMLTGDRRASAEAIGRKIGIDHIISEMKPDDKKREIEKLQKGGDVVAMVGDGINDAPALAQSDVGIALGTGMDVAMDAADVTLVQGSLRGVATSISLSRATMRIARQNLFFAFFYNVLAIPVAAGVLYPLTGRLLSPSLASAAMALSSVTVVANALRLNSKKF